MYSKYNDIFCVKIFLFLPLCVFNNDSRFWGKKSLIMSQKVNFKKKKTSQTKYESSLFPPLDLNQVADCQNQIFGSCPKYSLLR